MALPICEACAGSRLLCRDCNRLLSNGQINEYDVEVSRILRRLLGDEARFVKAIGGQTVVIIAEPDAVGDIIGPSGKVIREIEASLGRGVKVIGRQDVKEMARALFAPARISAINTVFSPGGRDKLRIRVEKGHRQALRMPLESLMQLVEAVTDYELEVVFD